MFGSRLARRLLGEPGLDVAVAGRDLAAAGAFRARDGGRPARLDRSDDAGFTAGIAALDRTARARGVAVLSGASGVPALSSAAAEELAAGLSGVHLIESAILPGNRAPLGLSVVRAILAKGGQPLPAWRGGGWTPGGGWSWPRRSWRAALPWAR